jgi:FkbH-like protein
MRFTEALKIVQNRPAEAQPFVVTLACGFTPLHLEVFLAAHLQSSVPDRFVKVSTGLYGDLAGTVQAIPEAPPDALAIAIEWPDLDPRLGYRHTGGWGPSDLADIVRNVENTAEHLKNAIRSIPDVIRVVVSLPTLPLPPIFYTPVSQTAEAELCMQSALLDLAKSVATAHVAIISSQELAERSPTGARFDLKTDLLTGIPYTLAHAEAVAQTFAYLIRPPTPKKGLITDADDTLWRGIIGDLGVNGVTWDLSSHAQVHGVYQQLLRALAEQGVFIGIASKNDPELVRNAFARSDMLLPLHRVFPLEVHWHAKSGSVERILKTWNIGADSVVFVDDSPMELAEVKQQHPGMECVLFPKHNYAHAPSFFRELRGYFAKLHITQEDAMRLDSIRQSATWRQPGEGSAVPETFLGAMNARMTVDFQGAAADPRVLELVNKTNQFNLNGIRYTEADWRKQMALPGAFVASVAYEDRFGPLGKIAVLQGREEGTILHITTWVMSCRSFARRIEHQCIRMLFSKFAATRICFQFAPTPKNGPLQEFFQHLMKTKPCAPFDLRREIFDANCPELYQTVMYADQPHEMADVPR